MNLSNILLEEDELKFNGTEDISYNSEENILTILTKDNKKHKYKIYPTQTTYIVGDEKLNEESNNNENFIEYIGKKI